MSDTDIFSDLQIIARTLDGEAGNQGLEGIQGVGSVILRRVLLKWQGETTARGVCLHAKQFSCWLPSRDRNRIMGQFYFAPPKCMEIAQQITVGTLPDNTNGADSYIVTGMPYYWAIGLTPVAIIGNQSFYITRS